MSVQNIDRNNKVDLAAVKTEISKVNGEINELNKSNESIFIIDADKATKAPDKNDEVAEARQRTWLNYILEMLERMATSAMRIEANLDAAGTPGQRSLIYDAMEPTMAAPKPVSKEKIEQELKDKKEADKVKEEVKAKNKEELKEVKEKEVKEKKEAEEAKNLFAK